MSDDEQPDTSHQFDSGNSPGSPVAESYVACVWAAEKSTGPEDGWGVLSLHKTKEGAEEAVEHDKEEEKAWHEEVYSDPSTYVGDEPPPFDEWKSWRVTKMPVHAT